MNNPSQPKSPLSRVKDYFKSIGSLFKNNPAQMVGVCVGVFLLTLFIMPNGSSGGAARTAPNPMSNTESVVSDTTSADVPTEAPVTQPEPQPTQPELTLSQRNAIGSAQSYLKLGGFSRSALIRQLEFDKYSTEDAEFAVDYLNPDFNEQVVISANRYIDLMSFSHDGLIDQLKFDGHTDAEAEYGATAVGY